MIVKNEMINNISFLVKHLFLFIFLLASFFTVLSLSDNLDNNLSLSLKDMDDTISSIDVMKMPKQRATELRKDGYSIFYKVGMKYFYDGSLENIYATEGLAKGTCYLSVDIAKKISLVDGDSIDLYPNGASEKQTFTVLVATFLPMEGFYISDDDITTSPALIILNNHVLTEILDEALTFGIVNDYGVISSYRSIKQVSNIVKIIFLFLTIAGSIMLLISLLSLIEQRSSFVGILRSEGFSKLRIYFIYYVVFFPVIILASLLGYFLSFFTSRYMNSSLENLFKHQIVMTSNPINLLWMLLILNASFIVVVFLYNALFGKNIVWNMKEE